ncbi:MAG: hypothetical protein ABJI00_10360 [Paracoccaceae bacterium]
MSAHFTEYLLRNIEAETSREFLAGMFFRFAFGAIIALELLALLFVDHSARGDSGNMLAERIDALSVAVFLISTFFAGYWIVFLHLNRERIASLHRAIKSSSDMDSDVFEFFEISKRYSYEVGVGSSVVFLARLEPIMWWTLSTFVGFVVLARLEIIS